MPIILVSLLLYPWYTLISFLLKSFLKEFEKNKSPFLYFHLLPRLEMHMADNNFHVFFLFLVEIRFSDIGLSVQVALPAHVV